MTHQFGIDISKYQDPALINYDQIAEQVDFVILRIGFGWAKDIHFERHYLAFTQRGKRIGGYHFPLNTRLQEQADLVKQALDGKRIEAGLWVDVEAQYQSRSEINAYIPILENTLDTEVGIYTSYSKWLEVMQNETRWASRRLWVANYGVSVPRLPSPWKKWCVWQYSSTGRLNGYSGNLDLDWANADCLSSIPAIGEETPIEPPEPETPLFRVRIATVKPNKYRVYKAVNGEVYPREPYWLDSGDERDVYQVQGDWYRIGAGQWIRNTQWVVIVGETPPTFDGTYFGAVYWQKDPRWKDKPLGTKSTLGANGCALMCETMAMNALGFCTNPVSNNEWRTKHAGYANGNLIIWEKAQEQFPGVVYEGMQWWVSDEQIKASIRSGRYPIILVDLDETTPEENMHWIFGIGLDEQNDILAIDPWTGKIIRFRDVYKKPVVRFGTYRKGTS